MLERSRSTLEASAVNLEGLRVLLESSRSTAEGLRILLEGSRSAWERLAVLLERSRFIVERLAVTSETASHLDRDQPEDPAESARLVEIAGAECLPDRIELESILRRQVGSPLFIGLDEIDFDLGSVITFVEELGVVPHIGFMVFCRR